GSKKCDMCIKKNIDCIIYKPKLKDLEIKRLYKLVKNQEEEISTLKKRL
ncbi:18687_t:CDS:1, partial [Racocetra persica]